MAWKVVVDFDLCESNAICMGIVPEVFEVRDDNFLYVLQENPPDELRAKWSRLCRSARSKPSVSPSVVAAPRDVGGAPAPRRRTRRRARCRRWCGQVDDLAVEDREGECLKVVELPAVTLGGLAVDDDHGSLAVGEGVLDLAA